MMPTRDASASAYGAHRKGSGKGAEARGDGGGADGAAADGPRGVRGRGEGVDGAGRRLLHVVRRQHERAAALALGTDALPQELARTHIDAGGGLVEEADLGAWGLQPGRTGLQARRGSRP